MRGGWRSSSSSSCAILLIYGAVTSFRPVTCHSVREGEGGCLARGHREQREGASDNEARRISSLFHLTAILLIHYPRPFQSYSHSVPPRPETCVILIITHFTHELTNTRKMIVIDVIACFHDSFISFLSESFPLCLVILPCQSAIDFPLLRATVRCHHLWCDAAIDGERKEEDWNKQHAIDWPLVRATSDLFLFHDW